MNIFARMFQHLLPRARAWSLTIQKTLRDFFGGLEGLGSDIKDFADDAYEDIFPDTTRELPEWENQFNLRDSGLSDAERRVRLDGAWKSQGGQTPRYIQDTLRAQGFDVFVHEWWVPGTENPVDVLGCIAARDPRLVIRREFTTFAQFISGCGEAEMQCGEAFAQCGQTLEALGYPLVNKVHNTLPDVFTLCGEAEMQCGEERAQCGNFSGFILRIQNYIVPNDPNKWPYFLYIGGEAYPDIASIPSNRKNEFEELCLKICPTQQWLGILVKYT